MLEEFMPEDKPALWNPRAIWFIVALSSCVTPCLFWAFKRCMFVEADSELVVRKSVQNYGELGMDEDLQPLELDVESGGDGRRFSVVSALTAGSPAGLCDEQACDGEQR